MRVYELARDLGVPSKDLLTVLDELGWDERRTASSSVPVDAVVPLRSAFDPPQQSEPEPDEGADDDAAHVTPEPIHIPELEPVTIDPVDEATTTEESSPATSSGTRGAGRGIARVASMALIWLILGAFSGLVLAVTAPYLLGYRSLTVLSGSMTPAIGVGDVVIVHEIAPLDARVGDVVSFRDPSDASRLITHRVRQIGVKGNEVHFVTKGDANTSVEQWTVTTDGTIGRVSYRVPKIGYALFWVRGRFGRLLLVVIPALVLGAYELWRIWRPSASEHTEDHSQLEGVDE